MRNTKEGSAVKLQIYVAFAAASDHQEKKHCVSNLFVLHIFQFKISQRFHEGAMSPFSGNQSYIGSGNCVQKTWRTVG